MRQTVRRSTARTRAARTAAGAAALAALATLSADGGALAQGAGGCRQTASGDTHVVLACGGGLEITVERGTRYGVVDSDGDGAPEGVRLSSGAVYVDARKRLSSFQILTPIAIAAIRGTAYAVDAARGSTAVFVERGAVNVIARDTRAGLVLKPGEGTDVRPGEERLVARRWGAGRVDSLLARLGRR